MKARSRQPGRLTPNTASKLRNKRYLKTTEKK